jgi:hypothetical protein
MHSSSEGTLPHPECRQNQAALITDYGWILYLGPSVIVGIAFIFLRLFSKSNSPVIWITFLVAWPLGIALAFTIYWLGRKGADCLPSVGFWVVAIGGGPLWGVIHFVVAIVTSWLVIALTSPGKPFFRVLLTAFEFAQSRMLRYVIVMCIFYVPIHLAYSIARRKKVRTKFRSA